VRILIVDDNADSADACSMVLEMSGHETRAVYSGDKALALLEEFAPQVGLIDLGMPGMDGYELARRLRQTPTGERMLLVALTGWDGAEIKAEVKAAGFDDHVCKPVDLNALQQRLLR
jgi:CheY-like chemotaxis protein